MIDKNRDSSFFDVRILRQDGPGKHAYWEKHKIYHEPDMNIISVLQRIAAKPKTVEGQQVAPVAWSCNCLEEVCGACTMSINGQVRQACTALVDNLLKDDNTTIELRPMSKFPVVRDLVVDRSRMFRALKKVKAWVSVDGYYDMGPGPKQSRSDQEQSYPLSQCMSCGCCLEACPQYLKVEIPKKGSESTEEHQTRVNHAHDNAFVGAAVISQVVLFNNHPTGKNQAAERLEALTEPGGIQICGNAQNCVAVCPKEIPLTASIAKAGRQTTVHKIKKWFDR